MFQRIPFALAVVAIVAGCSSGVDLDNVPVEDKTGSALSTTGNGADSGSTGQSGVRGVDLTQSGRDGAGPVGVSRVIYFDYDSYVIKPDFQSVVDAHARFIKSGGPARKVMIEGHTDERGGREYNLALGQKRAEAVRRSLGLLGVPDGQMEAVSFGKEKLAAHGNSEDIHALNRRAELSYR